VHKSNDSSINNLADEFHLPVGWGIDSLTYRGFDVDASMARGVVAIGLKVWSEQSMGCVKRQLPTQGTLTQSNPEHGGGK
jgi:hypothetical protein